MNPQRDALTYRALRAPSRSGEALLEPPLGEALAEAASSTFAPCSLLGRGGDDLRAAARRDLLTAARAYTAQYRDPPAPAPRDFLVLAGHQPELFHAGVWFKNFLLHEAAERVQGAAVNLVIDNDLCRRPAMETPTRAGGALRRVWTPYDAAGPAVPYEDRPVLQPDLFRDFPRAVRDLLPAELQPTLLESLWRHVREAWSLGPELGLAVARGRHRLEQDLGLATLELPLSYLCRTPWFCWFVAALIAERERFAAHYNRTLEEYRGLHRLRNPARPAPNLRVEEGACELPFWAWSSEQPQREQLFARRRAGEIALFTRSAELGRIPEPAADPEGAAAALLQWQTGRWRIRPRALITTLYARLLLGDLFIHGIGGAKYDQATDLIARRWLGREPAPYLVATATCRLPLREAGTAEGGAQPRDALAKLRALRYQPERFAAEADLPPEQRARFDELAAEKRRWCLQTPSKGSGRPRHDAIRALNSQMESLLETYRENLEGELAELRRSAARREAAESREYAFGLYPEGSLPELFHRLAAAS